MAEFAVPALYVCTVLAYGLWIVLEGTPMLVAKVIALCGTLVLLWMAILAVYFFLLWFVILPIWFLNEKQ